MSHGTYCYRSAQGYAGLFGTSPLYGRVDQHFTALGSLCAGDSHAREFDYAV